MQNAFESQHAGSIWLHSAEYSGRISRRPWTNSSRSSAVFPLSLLRHFELEEASDTVALHPINKQILPRKHRFPRAADYFSSKFRSHISATWTNMLFCTLFLAFSQSSSVNQSFSRMLCITQLVCQGQGRSLRKRGKTKRNQTQVGKTLRLISRKEDGKVRRGLKWLPHCQCTFFPDVFWK